jgi:membrane protein
MKPKSLWKLLKTIFIKWLEDDPFQSAAALSYYTLFSLAPLLIISIAVAGFVFGREAAQNQIVSTIQGLIGQESAQAVQAMIQNASTRPKTGMISTLLGGVILLFGAGGVVGQLQTSLNTIWGVKTQSESGLRDFIRKRFISFAMVLGVGFLLLVSLAVSAFISGLTQFIGSLFEGVKLIAHLLDILISFGFITLLFAMIYKFLPDVEIQWQDVWTGAALTSILFTIGKILIGLYLGSSGVTSIYGAAGSLITVLLWVYYSSLIFLFGAEFTEVYANTYGSGVVPTQNAESIAAAAESDRQSPPQKTYLFADVNFKDMEEETESHHNYYHKTRTVENMTQRNGGDDCVVGERKANRTKSDRIADVIATVAFTDMARSAHWHRSGRCVRSGSLCGVQL